MMNVNYFGVFKAPVSQPIFPALVFSKGHLIRTLTQIVFKKAKVPFLNAFFPNIINTFMLHFIN